jgi:hypothetical protein
MKAISESCEILELKTHEKERKKEALFFFLLFAFVSVNVPYMIHTHTHTHTHKRGALLAWVGKVEPGESTMREWVI